LLHGNDFGMGRARPFVETFADQLPALDDDGPDGRIWPSQTFTFASQFKGPQHPFFVLCHSLAHHPIPLLTRAPPHLFPLPKGRG
jgi:hypothetical protein